MFLENQNLNFIKNPRISGEQFNLDSKACIVAV